jgi:hypothetical protein
VDFENEIMKDPSFVGTKEDCVLNELISSGNNLFKRLSNAFTDNKSKFKLKFTTFTENSGAVFRTTPPDANNIVEIKLNLTQANGRSIDIAAAILHETIHAELHRIYISNNAPPYNYSQERFNWLKRMYEYYQDINPKTATTNAQHFYMAQYFITPLRDAIREYDSFSQTPEHYKYLAWDGLQLYGIQSNLVTQDELNDFENLTSILYNDNYESSCNN